MRLAYIRVRHPLVTVAAERLRESYSTAITIAHADEVPMIAAVLRTVDEYRTGLALDTSPHV